jgi:phosphatidylserine/phosphatidylglycerophosphate/cardiolipin synthase-like enzyme
VGTPEKVTKNGRSRPADRIVTTPAARRQVVLDTIHGAESRITLSLFRCTDKAIFGELAAAVDRGVDVQVLVTSRAKGGKKKLKKLWKRLEETRASIVPYTDPVVKYHAKYLVVDDGPALITSMNFTRKCFDETCDAVAVTYDPAIVEGLRQLMATDRECGAAPSTVSERLIIGPERARRQFTALLQQARKSIQIIDAKMSDPGLIDLLNQRRSQGIAVEIFGQKRVGNLISHGKMMLVDGARAVVGSLALTALSLDFRREVALVVDEPAAVAELDQLFRSIGAAVSATDTPSAAAAGGA